ncbi:NTP transferase domain-containing protein [Arthrobacter sp. ISL-28]|uniref:molybdenum cofactor guanylyltransferase n=1 Tax=Arthrobacter sp. ISL-28 TaxID=2819108 RepID=UPI00288A3C32|nr:NTP transferase domain-containing protein [Arthrobacter sp. ISL-28]
MEFDALILAGGRSSRLGGSPKSELIYDGETLLNRAISAARGARRIVVVGPEPQSLPPGVLTCREDPPFAGPAAAIAAGLARLRHPDRSLAGGNAGTTGAEDAVAAYTLILACDMPHAAGAVQALQEALHAGIAGSQAVVRQGNDGVMAASADGRLQPLAGFYRTAALRAAIDDASARNALNHGSVFALLARLDVQAVTVPAGSTDDVDTWDDAAALGVDGRQQ